MNVNRKKLLFWGELPPNVYHGVSLCNARIISALEKEFVIFRVVDKSSFISRPRAVFSFIRALMSLIFYIVFERPNILYVNAPTSYVGLFKVFIAVRLIKLVNSSVNVVAHLHRGDVTKFVSAKRNLALFRRFSQLLSHLIVLSNTAINEIRDNDLIDISKVKLLPNTVRVDSLQTKEGIIVGPDGQTRVLYCLCNYIDSKRIDALVKIANKAPCFRVDFNGAISSNDYMATLKELNHSGVCNFDGVIKSIEKESKLRAAKALILPSLNEGMPLVILESLAQGTPVVCFDVGYIKDYVGSDYPGLVKELTDEALREKIDWVNNLNDEEYRLLQLDSLAIFYKNYHPSKIKSLTLDFFREI